MQKARKIPQTLMGVLSLLAATPAAAQSLSDLHEQRRERGLNCMTDHFHYGSSSDKSSKRAAQAAAIQSWADFVDFEYGSAWTSWARSGSKSISCTQAGSTNWGCDASARACRR
jgi:hypothetical protein